MCISLKWLQQVQEAKQEGESCLPLEKLVKYVYSNTIISYPDCSVIQTVKQSWLHSTVWIIKDVL